MVSGVGDPQAAPVGTNPPLEPPPGPGAADSPLAGNMGGAAVNAMPPSMAPTTMDPVVAPTPTGMMVPDSGMPGMESAGMGPATGTFPEVMDLTAEGPYGAVTIANTGPDGNYTVYHPEQLAPEGRLNPVVSWGNGGGTTPNLYPLLPHLASHGFVVVASNSTTVTGPEVRAGLDWIFEQNGDASSDFYQKLDPEQVGGVGYSFGGLATLDNSDDPRYRTFVIISGGSMDGNRAANIAKVHTPAAYFCTDDLASENNCAGDYEALSYPVFFGVINGSGHVDVVTQAPVRTQLNRVVLAWFRWYLMADETQQGLFMGEQCGLCQDSDWTVHPQRNWM